MDLVDLIDKFQQPIVPDDALSDPLLDISLYKDLLLERNSEQLCAWAKCAKRLPRHADDEGPFFCSRNCQFMSQQFAASLVPEPKQSAVGRIVERFPDQQPPKPLRTFLPDRVEGFRIRVGPHRHILDAIEKWFGGFRVMSFRGMSDAQARLFDLVNECLRAIDAQLKRVDVVVAFFVNVDVKDPDILLSAPKPVQMAFALAVYEYLAEAEVRASLPSFDIGPALYDDMLGIVTQADDEDEIFD
jgi:hypothetical protein